MKFCIFMLCFVFSSVSIFCQTEKNHVQTFVDFAQKYVDDAFAKTGLLTPPKYTDIKRFGLFDGEQEEYYSFGYFYDLSNVARVYDGVVHNSKNKSYEPEYIYIVKNFNNYLAWYFLINRNDPNFDRENFEAWFLRSMRNLMQNTWYNHGDDSELVLIELAQSVISSISEAWPALSRQSRLQLFADVSVHTDAAVSAIENKSLAKLCILLRKTIDTLYAAETGK